MQHTSRGQQPDGKHIRILIGIHERFRQHITCVFLSFKGINGGVQPDGFVLQDQMPQFMGQGKAIT